MLVRTLLISVLALGCGCHAAWSAESNSFIVRDVRVFDGVATTEAMNVIVENGRVRSISSNVPESGTATVVDGRGKTLLPGLIDSHVHVFPGATADALRFGITTVLDMFNAQGPQAAKAYRAHRASLAQTKEADVWTALTGVTPPGGHPATMVEEMGMTMPTLTIDVDVQKFIDTRIEEGSDYIKIFQDDSVVKGKPLAKFSDAQLKQIINAVHERNRKAVVHVGAHREAQLAFESGADLIAHMFGDQIAEPQVVIAAKRRGAAIIPTLAVLAGASGRDDAVTLSKDATLQPLLSDMQKQMLANSFGKTHPEVIVNALASVRAFHEAGVPILAGTDAPNPSTAFGPSLHMEIALLVSAGLTPTEALAAATSVPARIFELTDRGRIAAGMRADLVLVDGDPTQDITVTRRIVAVWKNGFAIDRKPPPAE